MLALDVPCDPAVSSRLQPKKGAARGNPHEHFVALQRIGPRRLTITDPKVREVSVGLATNGARVLPTPAEVRS